MASTEDAASTTGDALQAGTSEPNANIEDLEDEKIEVSVTKMRHNNINSEWRNRLSENFHSYQRLGLFTDLIFICSDGRVAAHCLIMGQFSTFLKLLMVTQDSSETTNSECVIQ